MYDVFPDLKEFVTLLNSTKLWKELCTDPPMDDDFYHACRTYLPSFANRFSLLRCVAVRLFFSRIQPFLKSPIKVKLHPFKRGYGYMLDCGEVHILSDLLFRTTHEKFISVLLHETAHVILSQWHSYDKLLQLDLSFAETYLRGQHDPLLKTITPVEFFAQLLADNWTERLAHQLPNSTLKAALSNELTGMHEKLMSAVDTLNNLYRNTNL